MGKIIAGLRITLDGVAGGNANEWSAPYAEGQVQQALGANMATMGTMVLGRLTYEVFAAVWPTQQGPIADIMNTVPKAVVSTTLTKAAWQNSTIIKADIVARLNDRAVRVSGLREKARASRAHSWVPSPEIRVPPADTSAGHCNRG